MRREQALKSVFLTPHAYPLTPVRVRAFTFLELLTTLAALVIVLGLMVSLARHVRATSADRITRETLRELDVALGARPTLPAPDLDFSLSPPTTEAEVAAYVQASNPVVRELMNTHDPVVDAWGNPVGFMPSQDPQIGMAPRNRPFCFSAGPDGHYLTRGDNLYSYEQRREQSGPPEMSTLSLDTAKN